MAGHIDGDSLTHRPAGWTANAGYLDNDPGLSGDPSHTRLKHPGPATGHAVIDVGHEHSPWQWPGAVGLSSGSRATRPRNLAPSGGRHAPRLLRHKGGGGD